MKVKHFRKRTRFSEKNPALLQKNPLFPHFSPNLFANLIFLYYLCAKFAYYNDGQTTVKRRSSDGQSQRNLPVTPKRAQIYV